jgi:hypothetical protein
MNNNDMEHEEKPRASGFITTSQGRRVKVDELDMAVLNIGHGSNPMTNEHLNAQRGQFLRPIYNVEPELSPQPVPVRDAPGSHEVFGNANQPQSIRDSTGIHEFDQIHAINPYAYDPLTAARTLLAPQGQLAVTGTKNNPFAHPIDSPLSARANVGTREAPVHIQVDRITNTDAGLSPPVSSNPGELHPVHSKFPHKLSDGRNMPTASSTSHVYTQIPTGHHDVTPSLEGETLRNTLANTSRRMSVAQANQLWLNYDRPSPVTQRETATDHKTGKP